MHYAMNPTTPSEDTTVRYVIDTGGSSFSVQAFVTGFLSALGHDPVISMPDFEGEINFDPEDLGQSSLRLSVQTASMAVTGDVSEHDREEIDRKMHEEVLESDSFPEVLYESSSVSASKLAEGQYWLAVNGALSLHGVTRNLPLSAHLVVNERSLRASGNFSILQSNYSIRPVSALGGTIRLKDELRFAFNIVARKRV